MDDDQSRIIRDEPDYALQHTPSAGELGVDITCLAPLNDGIATKRQYCEFYVAYLGSDRHKGKKVLKKLF
jgi:hypothetical protein